MKHTVIKKILVCKPLYFATLNYAINPWMKPGTIDGKKAMQQWEELIRIYKDLDVTIETIGQHKGVPDMVFATDQGIVKGNTVLMSHFRHPERQGETKYYEKWFTDHGYTIHHLPKHIFFEGNGETYFWNDIIFLSTGYRSSEETPQVLEQIFDREVVPVHVIDPEFYHLDMSFLPINKETVFYYPEAYDEQTQRILKERIPNLVEFSRGEVEGFAANSVVTDHHVVVQSGNKTFEEKLHKLGYEIHPVDLSEFKKSGGGIHCLTNILE